jgi:hypothetical protein
MAEDIVHLDFITPLQAYAMRAHELYQALKDAGFTEGEAWELLLHHIPDFEIPLSESIDDNGEDDLEETEEE